MISIGGTQLIKLINSKISLSEGQKLPTKVTETVINAIRCVFQTYVASLKVEEKIDEQSQNKALKQAKEIALSQLGDDVKKYVQDNFGDLEKWMGFV